MAATDLLQSVFRINTCELPKKEKHLLEIILFKYLYHELMMSLGVTKYKTMENEMLDGMIIRGLVNDLLVSGEYSIQGLAEYTGYNEDVIYDLAAGLNGNPTLRLATKIIELHSNVRQTFYHSLINKVLKDIVIESQDDSDDFN